MFLTVIDLESGRGLTGQATAGKQSPLFKSLKTTCTFSIPLAFAWEQAEE